MKKINLSKSSKGVSKGKSFYQNMPRRVDTDKISAAFVSRNAPDWWEKETKGLKKILVCSVCHAIYFDEHWHTWSTVKNLAKRFKKASALESICSECKWAKGVGMEGKRGYEGEVLLSGWGSMDEKREILGLVRNVGKRAVLRDSEDQIIKIEDLGSRLRIITTENQLAVSIGKQVDNARKGGKLEIKFSHGDAPARVVWVAPEALIGKMKKTKGSAG